ncbi:glutathione S-transferase A-like isoform X4 [Magallana gigas]|uniref:glutathione S-transferase A-like isoform X4 n=1 Tax=Magallana gigas TaxID=29159 RepID=UPI00333EDA15
MAENMFLFWGSGSIPCWKPMIVLEEKGFGGYKNKLITFSNKEQKGEDILKLNPRGQVPTFKDGDIVVNESNAICEYLEAAANMQQKLVLDLLYYFFQTKEEDRKEAKVAKKVEAAKEELDRWEAYLGETKAFVAGPDFSMADVWFYPFIAQSVRMGLELEKFPNMKAYYDKVTARPSVQKSWPPHWKEEPPIISPFKGRI